MLCVMLLSLNLSKYQTKPIYIYILYLPGIIINYCPLKISLIACIVVGQASCYQCVVGEVASGLSIMGIPLGTGT
jgi:hypothetical protein